MCTRTFPTSFQSPWKDDERCSAPRQRKRKTPPLGFPDACFFFKKKIGMSVAAAPRAQPGGSRRAAARARLCRGCAAAGASAMPLWKRRFVELVMCTRVQSQRTGKNLKKWYHHEHTALQKTFPPPLKPPRSPASSEREVASARVLMLLHRRNQCLPRSQIGRLGAQNSGRALALSSGSRRVCAPGSSRPQPKSRALRASLPTWLMSSASRRCHAFEEPNTPYLSSARALLDLDLDLEEVLRGNGVIHRTQKVIQVYDNTTTATSGVLARFPWLLPVRNSFALRLKPARAGLCVCVYYCRTYYKAVRGGERRNRSGAPRERQDRPSAERLE